MSYTKLVACIWIYTCDIGLDYSHPVSSECARLIRADGRRVSHRLTSIEMPHQIIVKHHFLREK